MQREFEGAVIEQKGFEFKDERPTDGSRAALASEWGARVIAGRARG